MWRVSGGRPVGVVEATVAVSGSCCGARRGPSSPSTSTPRRCLTRRAGNEAPPGVVTHVPGDSAPTSCVWRTVEHLEHGGPLGVAVGGGQLGVDDFQRVRCSISVPRVDSVAVSFDLAVPPWPRGRWSRRGCRSTASRRATALRRCGPPAAPTAGRLPGMKLLWTPTPSAACRRREVVRGDVAAQLALGDDGGEELVGDSARGDVDGSW